MGFRDRFYTPATARAILSWRLLGGAVVGVVLGVVGVPWPLAVVGGVVAYVGLVAVAMPRRPQRIRLDPFAVGEPWRQFVQGAQRAANRLHDTIAATPDGPLRDRMVAIAAKLDLGLEDTWRIARRGDEIDGAVRRLDPVALRSKLSTLRQRREEAAAPDLDGELDAAIASVESQLESTERLKAESERTASRLRLTQTRLDELVTRAAEVSIGAGDTDAYEHDVEDLVIELEGLRLAVEETHRP